MDTQFYKGDIITIERTKDKGLVLRYKELKQKYLFYSVAEALQSFKTNHINSKTL
jgi:hypothetical protein